MILSFLGGSCWPWKEFPKLVVKSRCVACEGSANASQSEGGSGLWNESHVGVTHYFQAGMGTLMLPWKMAFITLPHRRG